MSEGVTGAAPSGNIYDLGYRRYDGARLGRRHAITTIYWHTLRGVFGLGRGTGAKIIPIGLAVITLIPAAIQLGIAAVASNIVELYRAENYYGYIQWPLVLFAAAVAPEVVGRDQKTRVLTLYFSRSCSRLDYLVAKSAALTTAMLLLTLVPQAVLMIGNGFAGDDTARYFRENWRDAFPIIASGLALSVFVGSIALLIAAQTPRRAFATGGILAYFAIGQAIGAVLVEAGGGLAKQLGLLVSGFHIIRGTTLWIFDAIPAVSFAEDSGGPSQELARAGLDFAWYAVAAVAMAVCALLLVYRRYRSLSV